MILLLFFLSNIYSIVNEESNSLKGLKFGEIIIIGDNFFSDSINAFLPPQGKCFSETTLSHLYRKIASIYCNNGFPFVKIIPTYAIRDSAVDINIRINSDRFFFIGDIKFKGQKVLSDKTLQKLVPISKGQGFSLTTINIAKKTLENSGLVSVDSFSLLKRGMDTLDILFFIKEENTENFLLGGTYSPDEGLLLDLSAKTHNLFGRGIGFGIRFFKSIFNSRFLDFNFDYPYLIGTNIGVILSYSLNTVSDTLTINHLYIQPEIRLRNFTWQPSFIYRNELSPNRGMIRTFFLKNNISYEGLYFGYLTGTNRTMLYEGNIKWYKGRFGASLSFLKLYGNLDYKGIENLTSGCQGYVLKYAKESVVLDVRYNLYKTRKNSIFLFINTGQTDDLFQASTGLGIDIRNFYIAFAFPLTKNEFTGKLVVKFKQ